MGCLLPDSAHGIGQASSTEPRVQIISLNQLADRSAARDANAVWPARITRPFSLLGLTWAHPSATLDGVVRVRTLATATGRWGEWLMVKSEGPAAGDIRGATDPVWVGESHGVQAHITGSGLLPPGLGIDLINTDESLNATLARLHPEEQDPSPAHPRGRPVPPMITRAGWGADVTIVTSAAHYTGPTKVVFIHHTATGNHYDANQSASIVRGIQAYQVRSRGWHDIGYNFLIDKYGTIFEGRAGGVNRPVLGAHTLGFNTPTPVQSRSSAPTTPCTSRRPSQPQLPLSPHTNSAPTAIHPTAEWSSPAKAATATPKALKLT